MFSYALAATVGGVSGSLIFPFEGMDSTLGVADVTVIMGDIGRAGLPGATGCPFDGGAWTAGASGLAAAALGGGSGKSHGRGT